ncbi:MAG: hypothetical protein CL877_07285 [Dehalococcoidales bacterium]|mgnify:FL=1|jgi:hypothetical protein|nr:hypothetical protein [Dehalococcoidales bacterium]|tara:strand:+ start:286 stop:903 length:618 start_codon:yes stop_codon:yes gene_type:complete
MTMFGRFPALVICAMAFLGAGGCGADESGGGVRPSLTRTVLGTPPPTAILVLTATPLPVPISTPLPIKEVSTRWPRVIIGDATFDVELARTPEERNRGLSGRKSLLPSTGMLFVYEPAVAGAFWMRDMEFPLDFIWIGRGCEIVGLTLNAPAPAPGTQIAHLLVYEIDEVASYTLEVNAGEVERFDLQVGDEVRFSGFEVDGGGC